MKTKLTAILVVVFMLFLSIGDKSIFADDAVKKAEPKKEKAEQKSIDISEEGKIVKNGDDYILKTVGRGSIKLPAPSEKDSKIKLEDWVGKSVKVSGKGFIYKYEKGDKTVEKKDFEVIKEITLAEPADKPESKPEEKK